jgi:hypothetical protein
MPFVDEPDDADNDLDDQICEQFAEFVPFWWFDNFQFWKMWIFWSRNIIKCL